MRCYHCRRELGLLEAHYIVQWATKPKHTPYRWKNIGLCCEPCENKGETIRYEFETPPSVAHSQNTHR